MVFFELLESFAVCLLFVFFVFQVIIPIWTGTVLFLFFRSKARSLDKQMREVRSDLELSEEEKKLRELKKKQEEQKGAIIGPVKEQKPQKGISDED